MKLNMQPYQDEEDYWHIRAFLRDVFLANQRREWSWPLYRFEYFWARTDLHAQREQRVFLWRTENGKLAAVLNPEGNGQAFFQVHPDFRTPGLYEEMLAVAEDKLSGVNLKGQKVLWAWAYEHDHPLKELLARSGYHQKSELACMRWRFFDTPILEAPPPPGYTVRALGDGLELLERCYASGLGFHQNDIKIAVDNREDPTWYRSIQTAPLYRRDLDLVVIAADGSIAAFATIWFDDVTRSGAFEPVATLPNHQRRGLGKAVMCEGLRRLKRMGATQAIVASFDAPAHALYASVGFKEFDLLEPWSKAR